MSMAASAAQEAAAEAASDVTWQGSEKVVRCLRTSHAVQRSVADTDTWRRVARRRTEKYFSFLFDLTIPDIGSGS